MTGLECPTAHTLAPHPKITAIERKYDQTFIGLFSTAGSKKHLGEGGVEVSENNNSDDYTWFTRLKTKQFLAAKHRFFLNYILFYSTLYFLA